MRYAQFTGVVVTVLAALVFGSGCKGHHGSQSPSSDLRSELTVRHPVSPSSLLADDDVLEVKIHEVVAGPAGVTTFYGNSLDLKACYKTSGGLGCFKLDSVPLPQFKSVGQIERSDDLILRVRGVDLNKVAHDQGVSPCLSIRSVQGDPLDRSEGNTCIAYSGEYDADDLITKIDSATLEGLPYAHFSGFGGGDVTVTKNTDPAYTVSYQTRIYRHGDAPTPWPPFALLVDRVNFDPAGEQRGLEAELVVTGGYLQGEKVFAELWLCSGVEASETARYDGRGFIQSLTSTASFRVPDELPPYSSSRSVLSARKWQSILAKAADTANPHLCGRIYQRGYVTSTLIGSSRATPPNLDTLLKAGTVDVPVESTESGGKIGVIRVFVR